MHEPTADPIWRRESDSELSGRILWKPNSRDVQPILDSLKRRAEAVNSLREAYAGLPLSLHAYGEKFGRNAYDALLDLVTSD